ncbi:invasion associated locus B family protein [Loktanella sp. M215]|uniref:invasion associated locus B family protein n=1 Tax=Loktanella sp. M215 TaxID=2675431 RepID=UPI001F19E11A|nr:invasion associated locus B family protein [Loktanella sp. M215]
MMRIAVKPLLVGLLLTTAPFAVMAQSTDTPAADTPATDAPAPDAPATTDAPAAAVPATDAPATDAPAATPAPDQTTAAPADAAAAGAANAAPSVGQPFIKATFGDWSQRCLKAEEGQVDPCQLYQLLMDKDDNAVAEFSTFPLPSGSQAAAGATIVVPLETLLTAQLQLKIDNGEPKVYPFTFCNAAGCVARVGFTPAEITQLKRGAAATIRMVPAAAPDQEVVLNLSLNGFTAGYDSLAAQ